MGKDARRAQGGEVLLTDCVRFPCIIYTQSFHIILACSECLNMRLPPVWDIVPRAVTCGRNFRNRFVVHKVQISGDCSTLC